MKATCNSTKHESNMQFRYSTKHESSMILLDII